MDEKKQEAGNVQHPLSEPESQQGETLGSIIDEAMKRFITVQVEARTKVIRLNLDERFEDLRIEINQPHGKPVQISTIYKV